MKQMKQISLNLLHARIRAHTLHVLHFHISKVVSMFVFIPQTTRHMLVVAPMQVGPALTLNIVDVLSMSLRGKASKER